MIYLGVFDLLTMTQGILYKVSSFLNDLSVVTGLNYYVNHHHQGLLQGFRPQYATARRCTFYLELNTRVYRNIQELIRHNYINRLVLNQGMPGIMSTGIHTQALPRTPRPNRDLKTRPPLGSTEKPKASSVTLWTFLLLFYILETKHCYMFISKCFFRQTNVSCWLVATA